MKFVVDDQVVNLPEKRRNDTLAEEYNRDCLFFSGIANAEAGKAWESHFFF